MEIDRTRFLALVGALGAASALGACASGAPTPGATPKVAASAPSPSATASAAPPPAVERTPPIVAGPKLRVGPCVEGGVEWPAKLTCDDRPWEVDCERLAPPSVCTWATATKRQCLRVARYARPAFAATWIEGMLCMAHGDRRYVCQADNQRMQPSWMVNGDACRRDDAVDVCARIVKSCAGAKAGDTSLLDWCRGEVGRLSEAGTKWVEACVARKPACVGRNELRTCFEGLWSIDEE